MPRYIALLLCLLAAIASVAVAQQGDRQGEMQPPLPDSLSIPDTTPRSAQEALNTFDTLDGLRVELVAAEPLVTAPVTMDIAPDGRIWVVEMNGYMTDLDGTREREPLGRIVVLEDTDRDGRMDQRTVFLDGLVLPRAVHAHEDGALIIAPPNLLHARDTDGDGVADSTIVLDDRFQGLQSPEHAGNGLRYGMDNWLHCSQHPAEFQFDGDSLLTRTVPAHGQWGTTRDAWDRWYYTPNSYPLMVDLVPKQYAAMNPAFHGFHGAFTSVPADVQIHPIRINPGVNRGYAQETLDDNYTLATFTAACSPEIYLDDTLGPRFRDNVFVCEPSGNCIERRALLPHGAGTPEARVIGDGRSPMASTDERFRPVHLHAGSDGAIYVVDMYRGILQHRIFMTTFLRNQIIDRSLQQPIDRGRIWRLVPDDDTVLVLPDLTARDGDQRVALLADDNGATRLLAQRLIVSTQDMSAIDALQTMARDHAHPITRAHALWTLQGLGALDEDAIEMAIRDPHPNLRVQGLRLAETSSTPGMFRNDAIAALKDPDDGVRHQAAATLGMIAPGHATTELASVVAANPDDLVLRSVAIASARGSEIDLLESLAWDPSWNMPSPNRMLTVHLLTRTIIIAADPEALTRLLEFLAALPPESDWMTEVIATQITEVQRLRSDRPRQLKLSEMPFDWTARLEEAPDVAGGLLRLIDLHATWPGRAGFQVQLDTSGLTPHEVDLVQHGAALYTHCLGCHQANGRGLRGFYPPLDGSQFVLEKPEPLVAILLHGMEGPMMINGDQYNQQMPPAPFTTDSDIAAIASYVRTAWSNDADIVDADRVASIRKTLKDHRGPWTMKSLEAAFPSLP